jgi:elongation factor P
MFAGGFIPCNSDCTAEKTKLKSSCVAEKTGVKMVVAGDFKNGITFEMDGQVLQVVEFQHVKPGKGAAFVRTKLKNVITGAVIERTFNPTDKYENAYVDRKEMQYLYNDGDLYYFMDTETYDQLPLNADKLPDNFKFVKENMLCKIISYKGNVFAVEPPTFVELEVSDTEPGVRGDTATGASKFATLETGAAIRVPLFINTGDVLKVDTRTGEYLERV